ncbi:Phosphatidylinositol 4-kinase pik1alpha (PI4-kinase)(PtdIns-4-kinase) [Puccinia graminis f. sp. tritici]|uniref:1-phosphatidylinositol 4-kinase n=1 Tax=Puccinia graminis f. sp. tritici TaxID=56615 RepID=A0A5B0QXT8_PUCGR|nr:Phosphatidylinositol 4-kinase pik1alpha (PI4-kinase)(PtdIns-4-kinase) [Puccinia graminis f. sp. tritici]
MNPSTNQQKQRTTTTTTTTKTTNGINNNTRNQPADRRTPIRANSTPPSAATHQNKSSLFSNIIKTNGNPTGQSGGSGLLLRLFESEFFNVHLAISYLKTYHDSIGITYYLISRLNQFPAEDVEFYWPQLCHLLISRPTQSFALESFIIKKSQQSTHLAMKTLWYLQASLSDLSSNPNTPNFIVCHRAFNKIQSIIFSDPLLELSTQRQQLDPRDTAIGLNLTLNPSTPKSGRTLSESHQLNNPRSAAYWKHLKKRTLSEFNKLSGGKITENVLPTTVGMGLALAGIASPQLSLQTGHVPIEQSRSYGQSLTITSRLKGKNQDDNNSASDDEELDQNKPKTLKAQQRPTFKTQPSTRSRHQSMRVAPNPRNLNYPSSSSSSSSRPELTHQSSQSIDHSLALQFSSDAEFRAKSNLQAYNSDLASSSSSAGVLSPQWAPRINLNQLESHLGTSSPSSSILTAPIPSTDHLSRAGSPNVRPAYHSDAQLFRSPGNNENNYALPTVPHYPGQIGTASIGSTSSPRVHTSAAISQSAPSLPDALSKFKRDSRFHHPRTSNMHRNGKHSHQGGGTTSSPIRHLFSALSMDPSEIPDGLLNQVLKSQSMRSQLDLITSLQDIATRLVVVPKKARLSALRAELTVLNHSLPKGCCLGMYCNGDFFDDGKNKGEEKSGSMESEVGGGGSKRKKCHQRIVRISPNESVVLNSADRAPFLIHVEVLEDHLDFDPNRRSNYEDLRKAIKGSAISVNDTDSKTLNSNIYSVIINDSSPNFSESNVSTVAPADPSRSRRGSADQPIANKIKSYGMAKTASSLPPVGESFNHLGLSSISSPTDHTSGSSAHSSDHGLTNNKHHPDHLSQVLVDRRTVLEHSQVGSAFSSPRHHSRRASSFDFPEILSNFPEEEMDLVEQIYGKDNKPGGLDSRNDDDDDENDEADSFLYSHSHSESLNLPAGLQNKALDEQAWKRAEPVVIRNQTLTHLHPNSLHPELEDSMTKSKSNPLPATTTTTTTTTSQSTNAAEGNSKLMDPSALATLHQSPSSLKSPSPTPSRPPITLDEYAERMRMAAIMLAQLSASQQPPQSLSMTPSSAAGMVVGGAIGLGAGFVGVTVGAGLGAVVSRRLVGNGQTVMTSPIGRKDLNSSGAGSGANVSGQGSAGVSVKLDMKSAEGRVDHRADLLPSRTGSSGPNAVPRQKFLSPQQSQAIKDKIMSEMMLLEEERMQRMKLDIIAGHPKDSELSGEEKSSSSSSRGSQKNSNVADESVVMKAVNEEDPSGKMLSESWASKRARIRQSSPYGHLSNWNLFSVIVKTGTDLRQEQIIVQLINEFGRIWSEEACDVWVRYYRILVTGESTGLMETIVDAVSIHSLKKSAYSKIALHRANNPPNHAVPSTASSAAAVAGGSSTASSAPTATGGLPNYSIFDHYVDTFGPPTGEKYKQAQKNFMKSLVSYSIISYILQLKDRHNGNILIDKEGHIIHIDFGFVLNNSPGSIGFEMAPFKLSQDYIEVLNPPSHFTSAKDGKRHPCWELNSAASANASRFDQLNPNDLDSFHEFVELFKVSFKKIRKHAERIITIVELMQVESKLPCFGGNGDLVIKNLRDRFQLNLTSETKLDEFIENKLILASINSVFTRLYDSFQYFSQGVL